MKSKSFEYGQNAFKNGYPCIPALDTKFMNSVMEGKKVGEGIPHLQDWILGWNHEQKKAV